jgi:hypothetical protein
MEIFLLLLDEIDDAATALRVLWSQLFGFLLACGLFALSIWAAMRWPILAMLALFVALAWAALPVLRIGSLSRFKTDP